jgi:hypothetical protein
MDPVVVKILNAPDHSAARFLPLQHGARRNVQDAWPHPEDHNVLVRPTLALPSVKADHDELNPDFRINGRPVVAYVGWVMTNPFNLVSQCPVIRFRAVSQTPGIPPESRSLARRSTT